MTAGGPAALQERLGNLLDTRLNPSTGRLWSLRQVSAAVAATGVTLSTTFLLQLRHGDRDNPTVRQVMALAELFGVSPEYFFGDVATTADADAVLLQAVALYPELALWVSSGPRLSARDRGLVTKIIHHLLEPATDAEPPTNLVDHG